MTSIYVAMEDALAVIQGKRDHWRLIENLQGMHPYCLAIDPIRQTRVYCGTTDQGLWRSNDEGHSWQKVGDGITHDMVMSVAVSFDATHERYGTIWAGTEPSALFFSTDGGDTWQERTSLQNIPSKPTWHFPPRPYTHHVRWIQPDPANPEHLFVAIELGGIMRSLDMGHTWEDRKPGAPLDGHTLRMHMSAPGRVYEAAGDGYAETFDSGATWHTYDAGLENHHYVWSLAIDPANPNTIVASATAGPRQAHDYATAESYIVRRANSQTWQRVTEGLPEPKGTLVSCVETNPSEESIFYVANNLGIFRSNDTGIAWQQLQIEWPARFYQQHVQGLAIIG